jgi:hypothetical protein
MRSFTLERGNDESGVSGTGIVLEGVEFSDGKVVVRWLGEHCSTVVWDSFEEFWHIHVASHPSNQSYVLWDDGTATIQAPEVIQNELTDEMREPDGRVIMHSYQAAIV